jgi:hypothetical protein
MKKKECEYCLWDNICDFQDFKDLTGCPGPNVPIIGKDLGDFLYQVITEGV